MFLHEAIDNGGSGEINWCLHVMFLGWLASGSFAASATATSRSTGSCGAPTPSAGAWRSYSPPRPAALVKPLARHRAYRRSLEPEPYYPTAEDARYKVQSLGGGAYLGVDQEGEWVTATPQSATLVLGPATLGQDDGRDYSRDPQRLRAR